MSSPITSPTASSAGTTSASSSSSSASLSSLANPEVFLQLLISQLKNQDPENPADGTEFVTQLATFSQVGQSAEMVTDLDAIKAALVGTGSTSQTGTSSGTTASPAATNS